MKHKSGEASGKGGREGKGVNRVVLRTAAPQPTHSSITVPSLFTLLLGAPAGAGVPVSLRGVVGLEPGSVLCDAVAAPGPAPPDEEEAGVCTTKTYDAWRFFFRTRRR